MYYKSTDDINAERMIKGQFHIATPGFYRKKGHLKGSKHDPNEGKMSYVTDPIILYDSSNLNDAKLDNHISPIKGGDERGRLIIKNACVTKHEVSKEYFSFSIFDRLNKEAIQGRKDTRYFRITDINGFIEALTKSIESEEQILAGPFLGKVNYVPKPLNYRDRIEYPTILLKEEGEFRNDYESKIIWDLNTLEVKDRMVIDSKEASKFLEEVDINSERLPL